MPHFCFFFLFLLCLIWSEQQIRFLSSTKLFRTCHYSVLSPFQLFIPISAFYPHFQRFIPTFSVLSSFQRFILIQCFVPISAFYPHFSVLSPFQRFIVISAFYPPFSFRFQFPFPPFSFSVLSRPHSFVLRSLRLQDRISYFFRSLYYAKHFVFAKSFRYQTHVQKNQTIRIRPYFIILHPHLTFSFEKQQKVLFL